MRVSLRVDVLPPVELDAARRLLPVPFSLVAEEKVFGACPPPSRGIPLGAWEDGELVGVAVVASRWLRLLSVDVRARGRGVGTRLLEEACARTREDGETRLRSGDQPGNYLTPGVDVEDETTIAWLGRRGFARVAENENLVVPLDENPLIAEEHGVAPGYLLRRARADELAGLRAWLAEDFTAAWAFEMERALENDPPGVHLALAGDEVAGFACHDGNNRGLGWFGPAATRPSHRGRGAGRALLVRCLLDVRAAGHPASTIAWIGPRAFYEKAAGARAGRRFVVMEKAL